MENPKTPNISSEETPSEINSEKGSLGPIVGIVIILAILLVGGFLIYGKSIQKAVDPTPSPATTN